MVEAGKLDQHLAAILVTLHHSFHSLKMSNCPGQTIYDLLLLFCAVYMTVNMP